MAGATSNLPQIEALLDDLANGFTFDVRGVQKALGAEMADVVVDGIADRSIAEQAAPSSDPWAPLSPRYLARKVRQGYPALIGVRTGNMLSRVELAGNVTVAPTSVIIEYGVTTEARDKLRWFTAGRPGIQPPRPLWGLDPRIVADLNVYAREQLAAWIARLQAGGGA